MIKKLLLVFLAGLSSIATSYAQDPFASGIVASPATLPTSSTGTIAATLGNGSSTPIPQANNATYTINLPPNIGVTGSSISPAAPNFTTTISPYSSTTGTTVTLVSNQGPVPGVANYTFTLNVIGLRPTNGTPAPLSINAASDPPVLTNNPNNDNANSNISVTGALPVSLISFNAKAQGDRTVALEWVTSFEANNKGFIIERSKDLTSFERVGEVSEVAPNSSGRKSYSIIDKTPFSGTSYYRLSQTDLNGKTTALRVASVILRDGAYGVFPNPVIGDQAFRLSLDEPETATIKFFNIDGRALPLQKAGVESGNLLLKSVGKLPTGVYVMTVEERGQTRKHRVVIE
ncbi:hypothetical protein BN8_03157 [Fibrisoma limi BUZ 3]|uniref:Secretion system C-terminal sorting domain-containing protein n=1 Tax=Fibrisoma limi BUZ 3 TaxID=1185876 RepID=I2GJE4_9BACT|nr:T9SS type A sorting domain-containing protein [Fibrisoma limi]CCH54019.1 hypothetical protein BN8_03157 [Fibrisoma limi BUZ 3]